MNYTLLLAIGFTFLTVQNINERINPEGNTLAERILVPDGYQRNGVKENSFEAFLRNSKLKQNGSKVHYYNGGVKENNNVYCAVLDVPIGKKDLQQCADAVMRLRAEYLFKEKRYGEIHFNFLSDGNPRYFTTYAKGKTDYATFQKYMEFIFISANTASLLRELKPVSSINDLQIGDVFIQRGNPFGHAEIVMDVAVNKATGKKVYLLAQSYMPAQDIQILVNPMNPNISPWFEINNEPIRTPEWTFMPSDLSRF